MPAPAMPATMRGDGRGTKLQPKKIAGRYFAGKGEEEVEDESEEEEEGAEPVAKATPKIQFANVDLDNHFQQEAVLEVQRQELEAQEAQSASEYETEESEEEEEEEEEAPRRVVLMKPTFIPKSQRVVNPSTPEAQEQEDSLDEHQKRRLQARQLIEEQIRLEATQAALAQEDREGEDVDDTDDVDPPAEAAAWKLRELLRIRRDRDVIEAREREREQVEERRAMPEEDRLREDLARVQREKEAKLLEKGTTYHRGGFYQDDPVVQRRLEGKIEDTQRGAGLRGATRWTGLLDQDTSRRTDQDSGYKRSGTIDSRDARKKQRY